MNPFYNYVTWNIYVNYLICVNKHVYDLLMEHNKYIYQYKLRLNKWNIKIVKFDNYIHNKFWRGARKLGYLLDF